MADELLATLAELITEHREALLAEWRQQVRLLPGAAHLDIPSINDEVPQLLENLVQQLRADACADSDIETISAEHGLLRWKEGFDIGEVKTMQTL
jgi:hypothetical protein